MVASKLQMPTAWGIQEMKIVSGNLLPLTTFVFNVFLEGILEILCK